MIISKHGQPREGQRLKATTRINSLLSYQVVFFCDLRFGFVFSYNHLTISLLAIRGVKSKITISV